MGRWLNVNFQSTVDKIEYRTMTRFKFKLLNFCKYIVITNLTPAACTVLYAGLYSLNSF